MTDCIVENCGTAVQVEGGAVAIDGLDIVDCGTAIERNGRMGRGAQHQHPTECEALAWLTSQGPRGLI